jgi:hypothetical protein
MRRPFFALSGAGFEAHSFEVLGDSEAEWLV